jgi:hypothetical protein
VVAAICFVRVGCPKHLSERYTPSWFRSAVWVFSSVNSEPTSPGIWGGHYLWQGVIYLWWGYRAIGVPLKPRSVKSRSCLPPFYACFVLGVQAIGAIGSSGVRGQQIYGFVRCATAVCGHAQEGRGRAWAKRRWTERSWRTAMPISGTCGCTTSRRGRDRSCCCCTASRSSGTSRGTRYRRWSRPASGWLPRTCAATTSRTNRP